MLISTMSSRTHLSAIERRAISRLRQLLAEPGVMRGNLVEMRRQCGKKNCACASNAEGRHRSLYLAISLEGKRRMVYIPQQWEERVRRWTARYAQIRELLEQLSLEALRRVASREE
jgi:hypothetical protein